MNTRDGKSILNKLFIKLHYYQLSHLFANKTKYNRLSFYDLDRHAVLNVCKLVKAKKKNIAGLYQENTKSFWFPNLLIYNFKKLYLQLKKTLIMYNNILTEQKGQIQIITINRPSQLNALTS